MDRRFLVAPAILLIVALGLMIAGNSPAWWVTALVAVGVLLASYLTAGRTGRP
jgi:hypothetical protein